MIVQSAFVVENNFGKFVGIVAFDPDHDTAIRCARWAWGEASTYKELDAFGLAKVRDLPIFTASYNE